MMTEMRIFLVPDVPVWQRYPPGAYEKQVNDFNVTALFYHAILYTCIFLALPHATQLFQNLICFQA